MRYLFKRISQGKTLILALTFLIVSFPAEKAAGQVHQAVVLKRIGNVIVFKTADERQLERGAEFKVFQKEAALIPLVKIPYRKSLKQFAELIITRSAKNIYAAELSSWDQKYDLVTGSEFYLKKETTADYLLPEPEMKNTVFEVTEKVDTLDLKEYENSKPFVYKALFPYSFGLRFITGYGNFYTMLTEKQKADVLENSPVFNGDVDYTVDNPFSFGFGLSLQKRIFDIFALSIDYNKSYTKGKKVYNLNENVSGGPGLQSLNIQTDIRAHVFSVSGIAGDFSIAKQYDPAARKNSFSIYGGAGYDIAYADVNYESVWTMTDETKNGSDFSTHTVKWYNGVHVLGGIYYYLKPGRFFLEGSYVHWFEKDLGASVPVRAGFDIIF